MHEAGDGDSSAGTKSQRYVEYFISHHTSIFIRLSHFYE